MIKILLENSRKKIEKYIIQKNKEILKDELASLCGQYLHDKEHGKGTPLFSPNRGNEIIRSIYGSGLKCFPTKCIPSDMR